MMVCQVSWRSIRAKGKHKSNVCRKATGKRENSAKKGSVCSIHHLKPLSNA